MYETTGWKEKGSLAGRVWIKAATEPVSSLQISSVLSSLVNILWSVLFWYADWDSGRIYNTAAVPLIGWTAKTLYIKYIALLLDTLTVFGEVKGNMSGWLFAADGAFHSVNSLSLGLPLR